MTLQGHSFSTFTAITVIEKDTPTGIQLFGRVWLTGSC